MTRARVAIIVRVWLSLWERVGNWRVTSNIPVSWIIGARSDVIISLWTVWSAALWPDRAPGEVGRWVSVFNLALVRVIPTRSWYIVHQSVNRSTLNSVRRTWYLGVLVVEPRSWNVVLRHQKFSLAFRPRSRLNSILQQVVLSFILTRPGESIIPVRTRFSTHLERWTMTNFRVLVVVAWSRHGNLVRA